MNIREEYIKSDKKLEFFQEHSLDEQIEIIKTLNHDELKELLNQLSFGNVQRLLRECNSSKKQEIYQNLSREALEAIYKSSSTEEQKEMREQFERIQANNKKILDDIQKNMMTSTDNMIKNMTRIENSKNTIQSSKNRIKESKKEIKLVVKDTKRIEKIRKKLERKAGKLSEKANLGLFKKRKLKKLQNLQNELIQVNQQKANYEKKASELTESIDSYKTKIEKEKLNIENAKLQIKQEQQNIKAETEKTKETRKVIAKMDRLEKGIFGRKMYKKNVHLRDHYLTTMRKEEIEKINRQLEEKARIEKEKLEKERQAKENKEESHNEVQRRIEQMKEKQNDRKQQAQGRWQQINKNVEESRIRNMQRPVTSNEVKEARPQQQTQQGIQSLLNILQTLTQNGMIQQPIIPLQSNNDPALLNGAINTITMQDLIKLSYCFGYQFELGRIKAMQEQEKQKMEEQRERAISEGKVVEIENVQSRVLGKRKLTGFVNIPFMILIISLIVVAAAAIIIFLR